MTVLRSVVVLAGLSALTLACEPARGIDIYSWQTTDFFPTSLVKWRSPLSLGTTRIGSTQDISFDMAFSPSGVLWGTDGSSVFSIDITTGQPSAHIPITSHIFGLNEFLEGVAFDPNGQMYCWTLNSTSSGLYQIDPTTGTASVVTYQTAEPIFGLTFGAEGEIYASTGSSLVSLSPTDGSTVRTIGNFNNFVTSLGYGPDGVLRGLEPNPTGADGTNLLFINRLTAGTTIIGISTENLYGVAAIAPAPGTGVLAVAACGLAVNRRRRRRNALAAATSPCTSPARRA
jgi:hypothetical protein